MKKVVEILKNGEPVVFPTETVYGLGAPVFDEKAIRRVFEIKGRPADNPLIVHISQLNQVERIAEEIPPSFYLLARYFWPGPLTLIVKRKPTVPAIVSAGHPTLAIRMPSHPLALALIDAVGEPLVAPSANLSGRPSPTCAADVWEDLAGKVECVLDGGPCTVGIESTVLLLQPLTLLRPGQITKEQLEEVLGEKIALPQADGPIFSPGMKYRHYAPKAALRLVYDTNELREPYIIANPKTFYAELRRADRLGLKEVDIYCDLEAQSNPALMNRLLRASGAIG